MLDNLSAGKQATIRVLSNQIDPIDQAYVGFVSYILSSELNKQIITEATKQAQALQEGVDNKYSVNEASLLENAKGFDELRDQEEQHHGWVQLAEGAFQLGIVLTSVAIVARAVALVWAGALVGVIRNPVI